mmetsp:Transcript_110864/g.247493  ORF Transcript_110864/g.247493 Transcript_110864/m.247493 type:complete len:269 (+) Transcript_110864:257-1063(+)
MRPGHAATGGDEERAAQEKRILQGTVHVTLHALLRNPTQALRNVGPATLRKERKQRPPLESRIEALLLVDEDLTTREVGLEQLALTSFVALVDVVLFQHGDEANARKAIISEEVRQRQGLLSAKPSAGPPHRHHQRPTSFPEGLGSTGRVERTTHAIENAAQWSGAQVHFRIDEGELVEVEFILEESPLEARKGVLACLGQHRFEAVEGIQRVCTLRALRMAQHSELPSGLKKPSHRHGGRRPSAQEGKGAARTVPSVEREASYQCCC